MRHFGDPAIPHTTVPKPKRDLKNRPGVRPICVYLPEKVVQNPTKYPQNLKRGEANSYFPHPNQA
jgi:hypothetical protein